MKNRWIYLFVMIIASLELSAQDNIKIQHGPYLQNVDQTEATIVWVTNKPSVGWIEMAPDDKSHFYSTKRDKYYDVNIGIKNISTVHYVKLTGLKPGTKYRYRACAQEIVNQKGAKITYGDMTATEVYRKEPLSFVTNNHDKENISFAMINDIHGKNDVLKGLLSQCDMSKTDFVLFNGDMVSNMLSQEQMFEGFMDLSTEMFASNTPMYYCRGNHETRGQFANEFHKFFSPKKEELYFMFRHGNACFVVLDCGEDKPDSDIEYYGITAYDDYRTQQQQWLEKALESDMYKNATFKIIVCHMPPFGGWHGEMDVAKKFIPLLNAHKPDVYLCGHLHKYIRKDAGTDNVNFPIIVNSNNTLLKADVSKNRLLLNIYDIAGKEIDKLLIEK